MRQGGTIIGKQLSHARVQRNLTRQDLGVMLGISSGQVERFEAGQEDLPAGLLWQLVEVFDLPVTAFFGEPDDSQATGRQSGNLACRS